MKKMMISIAVITAIFLVLKAYLIAVGEYYLVSAWFENAVIFAGPAALLGGFVSWINAKIRDDFYQECVLGLGIALIGVLTYWADFGLLYMMYSRWYEGNELMTMLKRTDLPYLFAAIAIGAFTCTYYMLKKQPDLQIINDDIDAETTMKTDINSALVTVEQVAGESKLINNLRTLRQYEYFDIEDDLSLWGEEKAVDCDLCEAYLVRYDAKPIGYFQISKNNENNCKEITEFYGSLKIEYSYQILYQAFKMYFAENKDCNVEVNGLEKLPHQVRTVFEVIIKCCTDANYELCGKRNAEDEVEYGIRFKT